MDDKEKLVSQILELELEMFLTVPTNGPAPCQEHPEQFRVMRGAQFRAWSKDTLASYFDDLCAAVTDRKNLMTLKYARMDGLIPKLSSNPLIKKIVEIQIGWQKELAALYPKIMGRGKAIEDSDPAFGGASFNRYLSSEIETYSDKTLQCLYRDMEKYLEKGENMAETIYEHIVAGLGYESLDEAEAALSNNS